MQVPGLAAGQYCMIPLHRGSAVTVPTYHITWPQQLFLLLYNAGYAVSSLCHTECSHLQLLKHLFALQIVFALAGGPLPIFSPWLGSAASAFPRAWLVAYHSQLSNLQWNFRPYDPTVYKVKIDACHGTFRLTATRLRESLVITIKASADTFAALLCPTNTGFRNGSVHSFVAEAHIEAYMYHVWPLSHAGWQLIEAQDMSSVALEFGGQYRC